MKIPIPQPEVPLLNSNGTVTKPWYDFLLGLDAVRVIDLSDVPQSTAPANGNTIRYSTATNSWSFGA